MGRFSKELGVLGLAVRGFGGGLAECLRVDSLRIEIGVGSAWFRGFVPSRLLSTLEPVEGCRSKGLEERFAAVGLIFGFRVSGLRFGRIVTPAFGL